MKIAVEPYWNAFLKGEVKKQFHNTLNTNYVRQKFTFTANFKTLLIYRLIQANQFILLTFTEPYLEAVPQTLLLLCYYISEDVVVSQQPLFLLTIFTSALSSVMGMAKFLMKGPCKIIPNTSGFLDGFLSFGFPPLFFSIFTTLFGKAVILPAVAWTAGVGNLSTSKVFMWMGFNLLPNFVYVSDRCN